VEVRRANGDTHSAQSEKAFERLRMRELVKRELHVTESSTYKAQPRGNPARKYIVLTGTIEEAQDKRGLLSLEGD